MLIDNKPTVERLKKMLMGVPNLSKFADDDELGEQLLDSISWVEDEAATAFNGTFRNEFFDGNRTNMLMMRYRPITMVELLEVTTPILGFTRVYTGDEIKNYREQGFVKIFTFKLAVEQAIFNTLDYQAWGTIFPPLPLNVHVVYTYGFPQYDPDADLTQFGVDPFMGPLTAAGDVRLELEQRWLRNLQKAALSDAACLILGQRAGLPVGTLRSVSFDGYAKGQDSAGFLTLAGEFRKESDRLLARRKRPFLLSSTGG